MSKSLNFSAKNYFCFTVANIEDPDQSGLNVKNVDMCLMATYADRQSYFVHAVDP